MKNIERDFGNPLKQGQYGDGFYVRNDGVSGNDDTNKPEYPPNPTESPVKTDETSN
jgi:hypothetical protein